jgi:lysozyme
MTRVIGCDVSYWNGAVDFAKMKSAGAQFCYIKASQLLQDSTFAANWKNCKGVLPRGAYHFLDWHTSELTQAQTFISAMGGDWGELPPCVDFEYDPSLFGLGADEVQGKLWNFLKAVQKATGRPPMIYTGYYYWLQWGTNNIGWQPFPLWLAWYAAENIVKVPAPWKTWSIWQYTGNGNGPQYGSTGLSMDLSYCDNLPALLGTPPAPPVHPAVCPVAGVGGPCPLAGK